MTRVRYPSLRHTSFAIDICERDKGSPLPYLVLVKEQTGSSYRTSITNQLYVMNSVEEDDGIRKQTTPVTEGEKTSLDVQADYDKSESCFIKSGASTEELDEPDWHFSRKRRSDRKGQHRRARKYLTKEDISDPTGFIHVFHAEGSPGTDLDPRWLILLNAVGVTNDQLRDHNTAKFIYSFVKEKGGIEIAVKDLKAVSPTSTTSSEMPAQDEDRSSTQSRPHSTEARISIPLPPPPPLSVNQSPNVWFSSEGDSNSELSTQIRHGVALKKVGHLAKREQDSNTSREGLLKEIREGTFLRPVSKHIRKRRSERELSGVTGALIRALKERHVLIHPPEEDTDEDDEESNSEWKQ